jgi:hypothetical protein
VNFTELREELFARGTDYLEESAAEVARADRWLNQAYREICNLHVWPFLQTSATGVADTGVVSIPDLRRIRFVVDIGQGGARPLGRVSRDDLADEGADVTTTGTPEFYYVDAGNQVKSYPLGGTLQVFYVKRVASLSGTEEPIFDEEYHDLIVDRAMIKAYKDSDNFEAATALREEYKAGILSMAEDYQLDSREVQFLEPSGSDS